jgi:hypothetical protein
VTDYAGMSTTERGAMGYQGYTAAPGWEGWIRFASIMMILGGSLNAIVGIIALVNDGWEGWDEEVAEAVLVNLTTWGWVHVAVGALLVFAGIGVLTGNVLARTIGVFVAGLNMVANFFFIPVHPIWSLTLIFMDVMVIWALTAHGNAMRDA